MRTFFPQNALKPSKLRFFDHQKAQSVVLNLLFLVIFHTKPITSNAGTCQRPHICALHSNRSGLRPRWVCRGSFAVRDRSHPASGQERQPTAMALGRSGLRPRWVCRGSLTVRDRSPASILERHPPQSVHHLQTSAVTYAEILTGNALLPAGKRHQAKTLAASQIFEEDFVGRVLTSAVLL